VREHLRAGTAAIVDRGIYLGKWLVTTAAQDLSHNRGGLAAPNLAELAKRNQASKREPSCQIHRVR
jgi:hypothetical protein